MNGLPPILLGIGAVALTVAGATIAAVRRRASTSDTPQARLDAARRATRQMSRDARRRGKDTIRGEGRGGNFHDDHSGGSDSGGGSD